MNPVDIIIRKRNGDPLTSDEIGFFVEGYVRGNIPDYQVSALLMAIYFQGMTPEETVALTRVMRDSGTVADLSSIPGFKSDKHSTGGVGDKVSLVLAPLAASAGLVVPMISGRSLAHTGGTLDKLEAIPGFRTNLTIEEFIQQLRDIGVAMVGQTENLCPADRKIYALRDATGTVNAISLITASILSKKMAAGIDALVLDVKAGSGAIFDNHDKAWELAHMLVQTATEFGLRTTALVTHMEQPLGRAIGNWLETREAIETLKNNGPDDLTELTLILCGQKLVHSGMAPDLTTAIARLRELLESGAAFRKFIEIVEHQGGDVNFIQAPDTYPQPKHSLEIRSKQDGVVAEIHCREIGRISMELGAGRSAMEDSVDYTSGIVLERKVGEEVNEGEVLARAYSNNTERLQKNGARLQAAIQVASTDVASRPLIYGMLDSSGRKNWDPTTRSFQEGVGSSIL